MSRRNQNALLLGNQKSRSHAGWAICLAALILFFFPGALFAQEAVSIARGSSRDSPDETVQAIAPDRGIEFPTALTTEVLGNVAGGTSRRVIWESLFNVGIALDLEKVVAWKGGDLSVRAIYPQGVGLTDKAVHDFNALSNIDGYDSLRLYDAWLQQEFAEGKFSVRIGQILADAEFFDSDYSALFLNSSFGAIPLVSQNLNPPIFPTAAPGIRLLARPTDSFYAEAAIFSGDAGDPTTNNKHTPPPSFPSGRPPSLAVISSAVTMTQNSSQIAEAVRRIGGITRSISCSIRSYGIRRVEENAPSPVSSGRAPRPRTGIL